MSCVLLLYFITVAKFNDLVKKCGKEISINMAKTIMDYETVLGGSFVNVISYTGIDHSGIN